MCNKCLRKEEKENNKHDHLESGSVLCSLVSAELFTKVRRCVDGNIDCRNVQILFAPISPMQTDRGARAHTHVPDNFEIILMLIGHFHY